MSTDGQSVSLLGTKRCGRPTRAGTPCRTWCLGWDPGAPLPPGYQPPACGNHITPAERYRHQRLVEVGERWRLATYNAQPVCCHEWPVSAAQRMRANAARMWPDPKEGESLARELLADWQEGRCAICGMRSEQRDHDHETGLMRGWLCRWCNTSERHDDSPDSPYGRYRATNPASILGLRIRYYNPFRGYAEPQPDRARYSLDRSPGYLLAGYLSETETEEAP